MTIKRITINAAQIYPSTVSSSKSGSYNVQAMKDDSLAAISLGKTLYIPAGTYKYGNNDGTQISVPMSAGNGLRIRGEGRNTNLLLPSGNQTTPIIFTTQAGWVDYPVTAVAAATSGGNMSLTSEVSKVTITGAPASLTPTEMLSIFSDDPILYSVSPYELNYQHEISEALALSGSDVYLASLLKRTYTVANYVRLRRYNNVETSLDIDDITFSVDGDHRDTGVPTNQRPKFCIEIRGFKNPKLGKGVVFAKAWAGGALFGACELVDDRSQVADGLNGVTAGVAPLGYFSGHEGPGLNPVTGPRIVQHGRHLPTSIWLEEDHLTFTAASVGSTTDLTFTSTGNLPAAGDRIRFSTLVGTISAMNGNVYDVVSATATHVVVNFNSTGLAYTSGGDGLLFQPDQVHRYGEIDGAQVKDQTCLFPTGAPADEHENTVGAVYDGYVTRHLSGYTWGSTSGRTVNNRGARNTYLNFMQERGTQFAMINSFAQQHGLSNTITFNNIILKSQQDMTGNGAYFETLGDATVTDVRKLIINGLYVSGGANSILLNAANAGSVEIKNFQFSGDWAYASGTAYMFDQSAATDFLLEDSVFDFSNLVSELNVRVFVQRLGGTSTFRRCHFKGLAGTAQNPFSIRTTGGAIVVFEDCTFECSSAATDNTVRMIIVDNIAATVIFRGTTKLVNSVKMATARPLVTANNASGVATVIVEGPIVADGKYTIVANTSSGTNTVTYRYHNPLAIHAAGTAYSLTATPTALTFGTTSPAVTLNVPGTYRITATTQLDYNAATFAAVRTATLKLRRTNNTAADITSGSRALKTQIVTTLSGTFIHLTWVVDYATQNIDDAIAIFGDISVVPTAGSLDAVAASIHAVKLY